jgi:hypothetical protein
MTTKPTRSRGKRGRQAAGAAANGADASTALVKVAPAKRRGRKPLVAVTDKIAEVILERLRAGETLRHICKSPGPRRVRLSSLRTV